MLLSSQITNSQSDRIPSTPPVIAPVPAHVYRPQWSVMIPTYNCLAFLQETLECILNQDPGLEEMQIMVVDDCSTDGNVEELVKRVGRSRVEYFRQEQNVGSLRNFETCLNLATGKWVHILHGDDLVMPGFYLEVENLFSHYPDAGAAFTNTAFSITVFNPIKSVEPNQKFQVPNPLVPTPGLVNNFLILNARKLQVQPPSIVVKRKVYEQLGGFYAVHYGEDWEMWTRIAAKFPIAYSPKCLALYRYWADNSITQLSIAKGQNIRDITRVIDIMQTYLPENERKKTKKIARREYALYCLSLAMSLLEINKASASIQAQGALEMSKDLRVCLEYAKYCTKYFTHYVKLW